MDKEWTEGPWEVTRHAVRPSIEAVNKKRGMRAVGDKYPLVCTMPDNYATTEANAHLIAAAPELYEALLGIVECKRMTNLPNKRQYQVAIAALAKARGETGERGE